MFPFDRPSNYNEMLNKIGIFTFLVTLALTFLVAHFVPQVGAGLGSIKIPIKVLPFDVPLLYVAPAALVALFARIIRLHDKISTVFRIRHVFDVYQLLVPLAGAVGVALDPASIELLKRNRKQAMQKTFYQYASFEEPKISKALVLSAIDIWTWYWVLAETIFLLVSVAIILLLLKAFEPAAYLFLAVCVLAPLFCTAFGVCGAKARQQIDEIVSDRSRVKTLEREFHRVLEDGAS